MGCDSLQIVVDNARAILARQGRFTVGLTDEAIEADFRSWWKDRYESAYYGAIPLVACIEWTREALARHGRAKPQPHGGRMVGDDLCPPPPPIKPRFPSPRIIRDDFLP
jgi:hypothetical protein